MKIVDSLSALQEFIDFESDKRHFVIPIYKSNFLSIHVDSISLLYVYSLESNQEYILCYNHSEAESLPISSLSEYLDSSPNKFCFEKKKLLKYSSNLTDINLLQWYHTNNYLEEDYNTPTHDFFERKFSSLIDLNVVVPISKHYDKCKKITEYFFSILDLVDTDLDSFERYDEVLTTLYKLESNGLFVNKKLFNEHFSESLSSNGLVYSEYNIFTTTGRPSNRFNGINYAALPKDTGCRESFISRFKNGVLVQFDYDAYHLRLLAELLDYKFPDNISVHEYLGKKYFEKDSLSEEEYQESKSISFKLLYGGITQDYMSIDFFALIKQYTALIWEKFNEDGYVETPLLHRKLYKSFFTDINANKLLNYLIQAYETERNIYIINRIQTLAQTESNLLILYTYDSFLFDMTVYDENIMSNIKNILEQNGKYPVKMSYGKNYNLLS